jgi:hypothetical protein
MNNDLEKTRNEVVVGQQQNYSIIWTDGGRQ